MAGAVIYEDPEDIPPVLPVVESPFKEAPAYDHLTPEQQENSWFTDGSATVEGGKRLWRAVAYQPHTETILKQQGEGKSSQWAELIAVAMALTENQSFPIVVYTDSWAVSQGLTVWITMWRRAAWTIHGRELWGGTELWEQLWTMGTTGETLIGHVDAHAPLISLERLYNQQADLIAAVREINLEEAYIENEDLCNYAEVNVIEPSLISLARWAHETSGHMGAEKTYQWCHQRCIPVTTDIVKQIVNNCSTCTEVKQWPLQKKATGKLKRGMGPGQIWQVDYIGPLPRENKLLYALTAVDTYSGLLQAYPSTRADQKATLNGLSHLIQAYGVPEEIKVIKEATLLEETYKSGLKELAFSGLCISLITHRLQDLLRE
ncbi:uncharacterized protein LOC120542820 [Polypterus senegalus]|uniref:uncharacterized protein LOC120542820 n=1 Tax=Polypterus senegalus TaxID=55291 RepID=UPI0019647669|nr:uncharacterized protein LOC120542820 [Polypterus senegalus]